MRRMWIVGGFALVAAVGMGLSASRTHAQPGDKDAAHRKVTVTGVAVVAVKPDTARVSFAVKGGGPDFKTAAAECDKKGAAIEKALAALKIEGLEVKKGPQGFTKAGANPGFPGMGGPGGGPGAGGPPGGFPGGPGGFPGAETIEVSRTYTVVATFGKDGGAGKVEDMVAVADKLLATAATNGGTENPTFLATNSPYGFGGGFGAGGNSSANTRVEFYRANLAPLRQEALKAAVADALANAKVAAGAANLTAKDIVTITDQNQYGGFGVPGQASNTGRGEVLGEMELTIQVSVTFSY